MFIINSKVNPLSRRLLGFVLVFCLFACSSPNEEFKEDSYNHVLNELLLDLSAEQKNEIIGTPGSLRSIMFSRTLGLTIRNRYGIDRVEDGSGSLSDVCSSKLRESVFESKDDFVWDCTDLLVSALYRKLDDSLDAQSRAIISTQDYVLTHFDISELISGMTAGEIPSPALVDSMNEKLLDQGLFLQFVFGDDVVFDSTGQLEFERNKIPKLMQGYADLVLDDVIYAIAVSGGFCVQHHPGRIVIALDCSLEGNYWEWL
jgi:hypothetical protein